jgi:hypothetical protein
MKRFSRQSGISRSAFQRPVEFADCCVKRGHHDVLTDAGTEQGAAVREAEFHVLCF